MFVESGGSGAPTLLLLHGLGANAAVWRKLLPLVETHWPGRWIAPDLLGHGRSPVSPIYSYGAHAAALAEAMGQGERVAILGHSFGGVIGLMLATGWFGVDVRHVLALGVKLSWSPNDLARMANLSEAPVRWFEERAAAAERYLRVAGLSGLAAPESEMASAGIVEESGRFRLAADPRIRFRSARRRSMISSASSKCPCVSPPEPPIKWSVSTTCAATIRPPKSLQKPGTTRMSSGRKKSGLCSSK